MFTSKVMVRAIALTSLVAFPAVALVDKWTPDHFDWSAIKVPQSSLEGPTGLWMNMSQVPATTDLALTDVGQPRTDIGGVEHIAIIPFLGFAWRVANIAAAGIALKNTIKTCTQTANGGASVYACAEGVFGTALSFGGAYSAGKKLAGQAGRTLFPHRFNQAQTVDIEMTIIHKRGLEARGLDAEASSAQLWHDSFTAHQLRSLSSAEPVFLGYADDDHRLAKREFGNHPLVPIFRFEHSKHGSMEIATRDTANGTFLSLAYTGHPTHLLGERALKKLLKTKRQETYEHEDMSGGAVEARFDTEASNADPASIQADAGGLFNTFEPEVECFVNNNFHDSSVLDVQMYDQTNEATFGWGTIGIYNSDSDADSIEGIMPAGMPLPQCG